MTARRVADALGVFPGLITHYFRSSDELVAAAFAHAATREDEEVFSYAEAGVTPVEQIRRLLRDWLDSRHDSVASCGSTHGKPAGGDPHCSTP